MRVVAEKLKQAAYTAHVLKRIGSSGISVRAQALDLAEVARRLGVAELNLLGERTSKTDCSLAVRVERRSRTSWIVRVML